MPSPSGGRGGGTPSYFWFKSPVFSLALRPSPLPGAEVVIAAGGGGSSKTGIPNKLTVIGIDEAVASAATPSTPAQPLALRSVHDAETGDRLVLQVAVAPDARHAAAVGGAHALLYRVRKGAEPSLTQLAGFRALPEAAPGAAVKPEDEPALSCVAWSPDGGYLATGGDDGVVRLWDVAPLVAAPAGGGVGSAAVGGGTPATKRKGPPVAVEDGAVPPSPAVAGLSARRSLSSLRGGASAASASAFPGTPASSSYGPDEAGVHGVGGGSIGASDPLLLAPSPGTVTLVAELRGHTGGVEALAFTSAQAPWGTGGSSSAPAAAVLQPVYLLASASKDGTCRVWELPVGALDALAERASLGGASSDSGAYGSGLPTPPPSSVVCHVLPGVGCKEVGDKHAPVPRRGPQRPAAGPWAYRTLAWADATGPWAPGGAAATGTTHLTPPPPLVALESSQKGAAVVSRWEWRRAPPTVPGAPPAAPRQSVDPAPQPSSLTAAATGHVGGGDGSGRRLFFSPLPEGGDAEGGGGGGSGAGAPAAAGPAASVFGDTARAWVCSQWSLASKAPLSTMALVQPQPTASAAGPSSSSSPPSLLRVALGTSDGSLLVMATGVAPLVALPPDSGGGSGGDPNAAAAAAGTPRLAFPPGPPPGVAHTWRVAGLHGFPITSIAALPARGLIATGAADAQVAFLRLPPASGSGGSRAVATAAKLLALLLLAPLLAAALAVGAVLAAPPGSPLSVLAGSSLATAAAAAGGPGARASLVSALGYTGPLTLAPPLRAQVAADALAAAGDALLWGPLGDVAEWLTLGGSGGGGGSAGSSGGARRRLQRGVGSRALPLDGGGGAAPVVSTGVAAATGATPHPPTGVRGASLTSAAATPAPAPAAPEAAAAVQEAGDAEAVQAPPLPQPAAVDTDAAAPTPAEAHEAAPAEPSAAVEPPPPSPTAVETAAPGDAADDAPAGPAVAPAADDTHPAAAAVALGADGAAAAVAPAEALAADVPTSPAVDAPAVGEVPAAEAAATTDAAAIGSGESTSQSSEDEGPADDQQPPQQAEAAPPSPAPESEAAAQDVPTAGGESGDADAPSAEGSAAAASSNEGSPEPPAPTEVGSDTAAPDAGEAAESSGGSEGGSPTDDARAAEPARDAAAVTGSADAAEGDGEGAAASSAQADAGAPPTDAAEGAGGGQGELVPPE